MSETTNSSQNKLNTYTFSGIRFIPSYRDFDQDDVDVEASNEKEAWDNLFKVTSNWKSVGITHINDVPFINLSSDVKPVQVCTNGKISKNKYFKGPKSLKSLALDFIQSKGTATSTEIKKFLYETSNPGKTYDPIKHRGFYCSYFSETGWYKNVISATLKYPTKNEPRQAVKLPSGVYAVVKGVFNVPKI